MFMQKQILFTKEGYEAKQKEYAALLASRPDAVKDLAKAREMGDLSENGYYKSARMKLSQVDRNLRELKYLLKVGKAKEGQKNGTIDIGTSVMLETNGKQITYAIVGTYEASPALNKISLSSPLGKVLFGKKKGEIATLFIGDYTTEFLILDVL